MPLTRAEADSILSDLDAMKARVQSLVEPAPEPIPVPVPEPQPEPQPEPTPDPVIVGDTLPIGLFEFEELHVHDGTSLTVLPGTELVRRDIPPADPSHGDGGIVVHGHLRAVTLPGQAPIVIRSANPSGHRGHLMIHGTAEIDGVEIRDFGRTTNEPISVANPIARYACFAGETRFLTYDGTKTFAECAGTIQKVFSTGRTWVEAEIRNFGRQPLMRLLLSRNRMQKEVFATSEHRWLVRERVSESGNGAVREVQTQQLSAGQRLAFCFPGSRAVRTVPSAFGIAAGIVFGDGYEHDCGSSVTLWEHKQELLKYFSLCPQSEEKRETGITGTNVRALPKYFKSLPSRDESTAYLYGWLAGYFATDGTVSIDGRAQISSTVRANMEFVRDICTTRLGLATYGLLEYEKSGSFGTCIEYRLNFITEMLPPEMFVLKKHHERFTERAGTVDNVDRKGWSVVSVEPTDRYEDVFCAVVPDLGTFTLEDNILTGNCHWHLAGDNGRKSRIENCFIHDTVFPSRWRFGIVIHGTHGVTCRGNTVRNKCGSGIYLEDGTEVDNLIEANTVEDIFSYGLSDWRPFPARPDSVEPGMEGAGIWTKNPHNRFLKNVVRRAPYGYMIFVRSSSPAGSVPAYILEHADNLAEFCHKGLEYWELGGLEMVSVFTRFTARDCIYGVFAYPSVRVVQDGLTLERCRNGYDAGDYLQVQTKLLNTNAFDCETGISVPGLVSSGDEIGEVIIEGGLLRCQTSISVGQMFTSSSTADRIKPRRTIIRNVKHEAMAGKPLRAIAAGILDGWSFRTLNLTVKDEIFVESHNGVAGDNFRVYWNEQAGSYVMPPSDLPRFIGSPEAERTNAELLASHGVSYGGAVAPCGERRDGVVGFVCP